MNSIATHALFSACRRRPRFALGRLVATDGALDALRVANVSAMDLLERHRHGDWGNLDESDRAQNDLAVESGLRIMSSYALSGDVTVWVITEWDRSVTTVLLPADY
ncbi:hypothetical protein [Caballeronia sp. LZ034LL]|uniref:hypothetical protein n=1 Tax=Caballeronia sp. LZ034LL TaxID=3038567 RepID=UPI002865E2EE|nr:hypothetical protein [Caballeronia sp. LZ034LL]MDR5835382.1 hypothetical protein [Caballeronia sp. LZ034LL]